MVERAGGGWGGGAVRDVAAGRVPDAGGMGSHSLHSSVPNMPCPRHSVPLRQHPHRSGELASGIVFPTRDLQPGDGGINLRGQTSAISVEPINTFAGIVSNTPWQSPTAMLLHDWIRLQEPTACLR